MAASVEATATSKCSDGNFWISVQERWSRLGHGGHRLRQCSLGQVCRLHYGAIGIALENSTEAWVPGTLRVNETTCL